VAEERPISDIQAQAVLLVIQDHIYSTSETAIVSTLDAADGLPAAVLVIEDAE
jgi:hypothetical protein